MRTVAYKEDVASDRRRHTLECANAHSLFVSCTI